MRKYSKREKNKEKRIFLKKNSGNVWWLSRNALPLHSQMRNKPTPLTNTVKQWFKTHNAMVPSSIG